MSSFVKSAEELSLWAMIVRLVSALVMGMIIGIDRAIKRRGAGVKTHTLVCLGAALVMMTGQYIYINFEGSLDVSRMGAQVISGVGFLGVGTIIVTGKNQIRGLTTAAGLWACACLGLAVGVGFIEGAFIALILVMFTLKVLTKMDIWLHNYAKMFDLYVEFSSNKCVSEFRTQLQEQGVKVCSFSLSKSKIKGEGPNAIICIEAQSRSKRPIVIETIRKMESVKFVEEL